MCQEKFAKMFKIICCAILLACLISVKGMCVRKSRGHVYCRNEFAFSQLFRSVDYVDIVDSYLPPRQLAMFPDVQQIRISGQYAFENCNSLHSSGIMLIGCDGDYVLQSIAWVFERSYANCSQN